MRKVLLFVFFTTVLISGAHAQDISLLQESEQKISSQVMSPFCPGRLLSDCPSSAASDLRTSIRDMLSEGKTDEEIKDHLYALYGDEIRAAPPTQGFGLLAWTIPFVFLCFGGMVVSIWLKLKSGDKNHRDVKANIDPELLKRIEAELK